MFDLQSLDYDLTREISKFITLAEDDEIYGISDMDISYGSVIDLIQEIYLKRFGYE